MSETIQGSIKSILFRNEDNHYSVVRILGTSPKGEIIATGVFPPISVGEDLKMEGKWIKHPKFGEQFQATQIQIIEPTGVKAVVRHLSSDIYRNIGIKTAESIAKTLGENTMDILRDDPYQISKVPRFTKKKVEEFVEDWNEHQGSRDILYFLHQHEIQPKIATRIYKRFGIKTMEVIENDPYVLAQEVWGIGFHKADEIAKHFQIEPESDARFKAALDYTLGQSTRDGHTYLDEEKLFEQANKLLTEPEIQATLYLNMRRCLREMESEKQVIRKEHRVFQPHLYYEEEFISIWTHRRLIVPSSPIKPKWKKQLKNFEKTEGIQFSDEQREAIYAAASNSMFILTGGPGTGKTTLLKGLLAAIDDNKIKVKLAAPTGRAAKRMEEMSGQKAFTLHRILEYNPQDNSFVKNEDSSIHAHYVVVDEASMIDTYLMAALMKAVAPSTKLILVGDKDQLPSVGPGMVLGDLLKVEQLPKVVLNRIYRQEANSDIPYNANRILQGEMPEFTRDTNFHIREHDTPQEGQDLITRFVSHEIPNYFKVHPIHDIQVLSPMRKGPLGTVELNTLLQQSLNSNSQEFKIQGTHYFLGDKLMQIRNNYDKNIYNGDIGYLHNVNPKTKTFEVKFDEIIEYEFSEMEELVLAYATTIHKSQGSEYPIALIVLDPSHRIMLQRNLVYTAITRAKSRVFIISPMQCVQLCVKDSRVLKRNTYLKEHFGMSKSEEEIFFNQNQADLDKSEFLGFLEDESK